ncbi:MAG: hypothetical protein ACOC1K_07900, partial [Nanoarchaeota archaeon]
PAGTNLEYDTLVENGENPEGMSKHFFAACSAMSLPKEMIDTSLEDEDMIEDKEGNFIKTNNRYVNVYVTDRNPTEEKRKGNTLYSVKTTYEYRIVRALYRIANEMIKQENKQ